MVQIFHITQRLATQTYRVSAAAPHPVRCSDWLCDFLSRDEGRHVGIEMAKGAITIVFSGLHDVILSQ